MAYGDSGNDDDKGRKNPWGKPGGKPGGKPEGKPERGNPSPWGQRSGGGGSGGGVPPELEDFLRKAGNLGSHLPGGGNPVKLLGLGLLALVVLWLASGIYFIQPNENGIVLTFGKYTRTDETPGMKWRMPWPIQSTTFVDVTAERRIQIGFNDAPVLPVNSSYPQGGPPSGDESLMLTGDENIIDIDFVVLWRVGNAKDFLFSIRDPENTIRLVAASAMREIIGQTKIQPALTEARTQIQSDTRALMQKILDEYKTGVVINNVQLQKVDPPVAVVDAFNEVQRARQKKEELRNLAEAYRNDIIPRAKGESEKLRQEAEAYKQEVVARATGDADRFNAVYASYRNASTVTAERMYLETVEQILQNAKTIVLGSKDGSNVLPYLPLTDLKRTTSPAKSVMSSSSSEPPQPQGDSQTQTPLQR
jgi:membrane protease subunit HflK